jgi:hypothetical protein
MSPGDTAAFSRLSRSQFSEYSARIFRFCPEFFHCALFAHYFLNYFTDLPILDISQRRDFSVNIRRQADLKSLAGRLSADVDQN